MSIKIINGKCPHCWNNLEEESAPPTGSTAEEIVRELAAWSERYPRGRIYSASIQPQQDGEELLVMCDCKKKIEARLLERFAEQNTGTCHRVELGGYGLVLEGNAMKEKGCMPIEASYMRTFKNGNTKRKKVSQSMFFNYCPFCGEQYT